MAKVRNQPRSTKKKTKTTKANTKKKKKTKKASLATVRRVVNSYQRARINEIAAELANRQCEALRIFEPLPHIKDFHECTAPERILRGSNRCLAGEQAIYDPVLDEYRRVDAIESAFHVLAMNPETGRLEVKQASRPFIKGVGLIWRYELSSGEVIQTTPYHRVVDCTGRWIGIHEAFCSVAELLSPSRRQHEYAVCHPRSSLVACQSAHGAGDPSFWQTPGGFQVDYPAYHRLRDEPLRLVAGIDRGSLQLPNDAHEHIHRCWHEGDWDSFLGRTHVCRYVGHPSRSHDAAESVDHASSFGGYRSDRGWQLGYQRSCETGRTDHGRTPAHRHKAGEAGRDRHQDGDCEFCSWHPSQFEVTDKSFTAIVAAQPVGYQCIWDITVEDWSNYLCAGLINANSGKTIHMAVEVARCVTGQDPYNKYPKTNGRAFIVGASGQHISEVLYKKLFRAGAFRMIKDGHIWRTFKPWDPEDCKRVKEAKLAPPLIPPRLIKEISWEKKKEQIPNVVRMKNGWEIRFFSSQGIPPQGSDVDLCVFDEEIVHSLWYSEVAARGTVDRNGKFIWSATAQKGGPQLYEMCERAAEERASGNSNPRIVEFFAHINDNKHFTDDQRKLFFSKLSEEERAIRIEGEFAFTSFKVYPEFDRNTHGIDWFPVPDTWTRYMVVDPGRQVCAVLFAAIPPPDYVDPDMVLLYDELYIRQSTARDFGEAVRGKVTGQVFEAFLIDHQGGRVRDAGRGLTIEEQYAEELKKHKIKSNTTGHGFKWGSTDVSGGIERVRTWLLIRDNGKPKLMYFHDKMQHFWHEMTRYHWRREPGGTRLKEEPEKRDDHQCDNIRYLAMYGPGYVKPSIVKKVAHGVHNRLKEKNRRYAKMFGREGISLGGGHKNV